MSKSVKVVENFGPIVAQKWFEQGLASHGEAKLALQGLKEKALLAGWFFLQARRACEHGQWGEFVASQKAISERTIRGYMQFTEDAMVSVLGAAKKFSDDQLKEYRLSDKEVADQKLVEAAKKAVIHSSVGFVELCRELSLFRKFGEYDAVKSAAAKARAVKAGEQLQMTFDLGVAMAGLRHVAMIEKTAPESLPKEKLPELRDQLQSALNAVDARIREITLPAEVSP